MALTRRNVIHLSVGAAAGAGLASFPGLARAQDVSWDFSDEYDLNGLTGRTAMFFISELERRVGDELRITYQGGGALGYRSVDHFDAVEDGAVPIAITLATQLGGIDPFFDLTSLPFLVQSPAQARTLWRVSKPEYQRIFEDHGQVLLFATPNPPSGIHSSRPLDTPEALDGLRIRTYDVNGTQTLARAGASPLQIAWADLVPQLSTGAIDAVLTSADGGVQLSIWDYLSNFAALDYAMALFMAHANADAYAELSDDAQSAIQEVLEATDDYSWGIMQDSIEDSYTIMREHGMDVNASPPDAVFDRLRAAGSTVSQEWVERVGERGERVLAEFDAARG